LKPRQCLLRGTDWVFISDSVSSLKRLTKNTRVSALLALELGI
jgi:hypothetical protein